MNYFHAPDISVFTATPQEVSAESERSALADMSVVHVVRQYAPMIGGLEDFVRQLVAQQRGRFASLKIVTLDRLFTDPNHRLPEKDVIDGIDVIRIPFGGSSRYPLAPGVFSHFSGADLVHVHAVDFFFDAIALAKPFHRRKLVATTHGGFFHTNRNLALKKVWLNSMTRLSASLYDGIACCSQNDLALFQDIAPGKVRLIENGVDLSKFEGASSLMPAKRLLTLGRFSANKRLDRTLDALAVLVRTDPAWRLDVIGSPSDLSADDLSNLIESRGLSDHVDVHLGIADAAVRDVVSRCSLFVSASEYEGFGIAMIEALSAGLIPVVEPNTAFRSLQERHPMVYLADYSNPEAAAGTIGHAMAELERAPSLRFAAIASSDQHSWQSTIKHYDKLYLDALGAGC
jgi:alpha-1,3-mannosyltransferase